MLPIYRKKFEDAELRLGRPSWNHNSNNEWSAKYAYLDANGKMTWKASPRFLTMLADAEREAQDELEDFP